VNPRASRTVPFVAKTIGRPVAAIAAKLMAGKPLSDFNLVETPYDHIAVKEAVFPFARFPGVDTVLGPEMRSTGEVMGLDWVRPGETLAPAFARAFAKSQLGGGTVLPSKGCVFVSVKEADKPWIVEPVKLLLGRGFKVLATSGTAAYLEGQGLKVEPVKKVLEGRPHIVDAMKNGEVQLVFNTTEGKQSLADSFELRRTALMMKIPYYTTAAGGLAAAQAIVASAEAPLEVRPLQSYA
jgi:carbamoyl-phosphate synthase large subunit